jgi:hypothetical protein
LQCASGLVSSSGSSACTQCPSGNVASANGASCQSSAPAAEYVQVSNVFYLGPSALESDLDFHDLCVSAVHRRCRSAPSPAASVPRWRSVC